MRIGRRAGEYNKWSTYRGSYWTEYVTKAYELVEDLDHGGKGISFYQDYTPVLHLILNRWNDD